MCPTNSYLHCSCQQAGFHANLEQDRQSKHSSRQERERVRAGGRLVEEVIALGAEQCESPHEAGVKGKRAPGVEKSSSWCRRGGGGCAAGGGGEEERRSNIPPLRLSENNHHQVCSEPHHSSSPAARDPVPVAAPRTHASRPEHATLEKVLTTTTAGMSCRLPGPE
ncbi:unnamed protein product [Pleuronectes platessa]|uniref:Uncharacterized protein n=1 Tax=Pleuronectes platessa TaxID=8262 RepID=A0A9N7YXU0_PLEPL|nr:unnamed protein product [Pleuronectes platessa]